MALTNQTCLVEKLKQAWGLGSEEAGLARDNKALSDSMPRQVIYDIFEAMESRYVSNADRMQTIRMLERHMGLLEKAAYKAGAFRSG